MAAFFQSFRSSSMPKRLLRYALSRLDLLDAEALDMENLDFALGRNTVFEFRDVGIILKKLEKLLKLPAAFQLLKAKVLLLRVTIPMDFYTSPITIEVDGVDVKLKLESTGRKSSGQANTASQESPDVVPNTTDLAQSFLETQPLSEKRKLEEALAAENQDLSGSVSVSDDGSEDGPTIGTGEPLSLPTFLADFLQGIVDRVQIRIKGVTFQLDVEVPIEVNSLQPEPVSFQVALESIDVEGVTTQADSEVKSSRITPKEGKRGVSLNNVRAYLISEANVFSALTRSPSIASPSVASSPTSTRNPPSRQTSSLSQENLGGSSTKPSQSSLQSHSVPREVPSDEDDKLGDSEIALGIPYDLSAADEHHEDESPATPRASIYHELNSAGEDSLFHSTTFEPSHLDMEASMELAPLWESVESVTRSGNTEQLPLHSVEGGNDENNALFETSLPASQTTEELPVKEKPTEDLAESQLYTHEEAESMYMSAFSQADSTQIQTSHQTTNEKTPQTTDEDHLVDSEPEVPQRFMPGGWGADLDDSVVSEMKTEVRPEPTTPRGAPPESESNSSDSGSLSPAFSRASLTVQEPSEDSEKDSNIPTDDAPTPKGVTRVVKEIMHLENLSIYLPSQHEHVQVHSVSAETVAHLSQSMAQSIYPQAPGAFSVHASHPQTPAAATTLEKGDKVLEIISTPINVKFDASLAFLLAMVAGKLLAAVKDHGVGGAADRLPTGDTAKESEVKVTIEDISIDFLNRLGGVADTSERHLDPSAFILDEEVLLNASLHNLSMLMSSVEHDTKLATRTDTSKRQGTVTKIELEKFRFGYANGDIISFDSGRPMSTSVRDTFLSTGHDIGVKITQSDDIVRTDLETLPLVVQIDLQRLDETFSWFGGLSSFLNMSASMTSSPSPTSKPTTLPPQMPRGVRFETPIDPNDKSAAAQNKLNVRIGGTFVELVGKDCSVVAESNAVKVVSRDEGIGIACSMIRVSGPYLDNSNADPAVTAEVGGVRLDFLTAPKEADLEKLLELIMPSKVQFDREGDEIMVDTLLRQRRKGSVLRTNLETVNIRVKNMAQLSVVPALGEEIAKLSTVVKYLPEDDRPGILTFLNVQRFVTGLEFTGKVGHIGAEVRELQVGHITVPSLVAVAANAISVKRNKTEELLCSSTSPSPKDVSGRWPVIVGRMIGDEIEPIIKLKLRDLRVEYRVPTIMDILNLAEDATPQDFEASLAASVANLGDQAHHAFSKQPESPVPKPKPSKPMMLDIGFRDCLVGLNPLNLSSKMIVAFTDAQLDVTLPQNGETKTSTSIKKASILLTDDAAQVAEEGARTTTRSRASPSASPQVSELCERGFVDICYISSAKLLVGISLDSNGDKIVEVELQDDLLVLETCADSTQTLITLANALSPPTPPSKENKYRTNIMPVQDLLASISAEAFGRPEGEYDFDQDFAGAQEMAGSGSDADFESENSLRIDSQYYGDHSDGEELFDAMKSSDLSQGTRMQDTNEGVLLTGFEPSPPSNISEDGEGLVIHEDFYQRGLSKEHSAKIWNSGRNTYDAAHPDLIKRSPLKVSVKDVHIIWNLFDGYDWAHTRGVITKAVHDVENKAYERQARMTGPQIYEEDVGDETIGDFLFNSIYIGIAANHDPNELSRAINEGLNDNATETESLATTAITTATNRTSRRSQPKSKRLRLNRSKHHKITFELQGVNVDLIAFPPGCGETQSSIDVRVQTFDVFDHIPTSTWKKFATYDQDHGERELGTSMLHLEILNVRPMPELGASEIVMRATLLPLRLHVDQDALDFITRFFEFKDETAPVHSSPSDIPFLQRAEVNDIPVKLDFKPKRVDYAGLRSGHTTEFMNFIVLEEARMVLRHVIIYGVSGFDRLGKTLNDIWSPDVRNNQLPGVVAGLAPVRSLVNIGSGFKDLVEIPLREYKKDGRVIRSISKGAAAFARTTGTELVKLGAKLAVGTQYALQGTEDMLKGKREAENNWEDDDIDPEDQKQISLYADQPTGVIQGIRSGYRSLTRDVNLARDAIIAVPGEVMDSASAGRAAGAVLKKAPTIIFRPAIGVTKVIGQTLMGATNTIDPNNRRRIGEKYKH